jgi:hypothetical protein
VIESDPAPAQAAEDEGAPEHVLNDPKVRERINRALARAREGNLPRGKTGDELVRDALERRRMDPRP